MGSLNNELKDFIAAFSAGKKMFSKDDDEYKALRNKVLKSQLDKANDPETIALNKAILKRRASAPFYRPTDPDVAEGRRLSNKIRQKQLDLLEHPSEGAAGEIPSMAAPPSTAPGRTSALDLGGEDDVADLEDPEEEEALPVQYAARGGVVRPVRKYALGGAVEEEDPEDAEAAAPEDDTIDDGDDTVDDGDTQGTLAHESFSRQAGHDAARDGLIYARAQSRTATDAGGALPTGAAPSRASSTEAYLRGAGAASANEMNAVRAKIDPEGKMSESERNLAALGTVYEYNLRQNNPEGAKRAAASMVQYMRIVSDRYSALAKVAAKEGDVDGTLKAIAKAHANVPDGVDMKFKKNEDGSIGYSFVDTQSGKTTEKGVASPEQLLQWATRGGIPDFDSLIVAAGGQRAAPKKEAGVPKMDDRTKREEGIEAVASDPKRFKVPLDADLAPAVKHLAGQIIGDNDIPPEDALGSVMKIAGAPTLDGYKMTKTEKGGTIALPDGRTLRLSPDAMQNLVALRGRASAKRAEAAKAAADAAEKEGKRSAMKTEQQVLREKVNSEREGPIRQNWRARGELPAHLRETAVPLDD
jgi:hypothetical protein